MAETIQQICQVCGNNAGFTMSDDGFYYCGYCNSQADDIVDTGVDEENVFNHYSATHSRARPVQVFDAEPISQVKWSPSRPVDCPKVSDYDACDEFRPVEPSDFGRSSQNNNFSYSDYYTAVRSRYLTGLQIMMQLQCQSLVEKFNVSPLIIGLMSPIWLRFLSSTRIMADEWADQVIHDSEEQAQEESQASTDYCGEPVNILGKRATLIWYTSLRSTIPISYSLAVSLLVCHVAREAILPTDILQWALEGKLPYFSAFSEIEKQIGSESKVCPISVSHMFRPLQTVSSQKLESMAAEIAHKIGLNLPPVNFYAISSRYCRQLSLPSEEILPMAYRMYEWSMPQELYLSANELRIPTRVFVMSILIVAIRIIYDINGYGIWESIFSNESSISQGEENEEIDSQSHPDVKNDTGKDSSSSNSKYSANKSHVTDSSFGTLELLNILGSNYDKADNVSEFSENLRSYLKYCKEVIFSGLQPSFEDIEEEKLIDEFWDLYQNCEGCKESGNQHGHENASQRSQPSMKSRTEQMRLLKLDMEDNKFCYLSPRVNLKRKDYMHYARKRREVYIYAVHADYYILIRSCAKVAQVETRIMHLATLNFERRLKWLEKRIGYSLHLRPNPDDVCDFCREEPIINDSCNHMDLNM